MSWRRAVVAENAAPPEGRRRRPLEDGQYQAACSFPSFGCFSRDAELIGICRTF